MDEGGVLFCSRTEVYFGMNPVGAAIWSRLPDPGVEATVGFDGLVDSLAALYPEVDRLSLSADVREFIDTFVESELVTYGAVREERS